MQKGIKLSKLVKTTLQAGLRGIGVEKLLFSLVILISRIEITLFCSTSKVNLMLGC